MTFLRSTSRLRAPPPRDGATRPLSDVFLVGQGAPGHVSPRPIGAEKRASAPRCAASRGLWPRLGREASGLDSGARPLASTRARGLWPRLGREASGLDSARALRVEV